MGLTKALRRQLDGLSPKLRLFGWTGGRTRGRWNQFKGDFDLEHVKDRELNLNTENEEYFFDEEDTVDIDDFKLEDLLKPLTAHNPDNLITAVWRKRAQHSQSNVLGRSFPPGVLERNALSQKGFFGGPRPPKILNLHYVSLKF